MSNDIRPKWWQLYLTFPLLIALFVLDSRLKLSVRGHQVIQIGIIFLVYGLIHLWLKANSAALSQMDQDQGRITVIRIPPYQLPVMNEKKHPSVKIPDLEIKGLLSITYEMDYIDVQSFPVDEVPQELEKD